MRNVRKLYKKVLKKSDMIKMNKNSSFACESCVSA